VSDPRKKRGIRYSVALILTLILLAKLAGETKLSGVAEWARLRGEWLGQELGLERTSFRCAATYTNVLKQLDEEEVTSILRHFFTRLASPKQVSVPPTLEQLQAHQEQTWQVALDGKPLRGTLKHGRADQEAVHLLSLYEEQTGTLLSQRQVQSKENESSAAPDLLTVENVTGRLVSADAMHTQRTFCLTITLLKGFYLLVAKDNQPTMHQDLALFFEDRQADRSDWQRATTCEKGHGRLETRTLTTSTQLRDFFAQDRVGIQQVFRLERSVVEKGVRRREVIYGITSLSPKQAGPADLLGFIRAHWAIENRLHWRRDVTLGEDQSQVRTTGAPPVLAALKSAVLALMDFLKVTNAKAQMRVYSAHPEQALALLLGRF